MTENENDNHPIILIAGPVFGLIKKAGKAIGKLLDKTKKVFIYGGEPCEISVAANRPEARQIKPDRFVSMIDDVARLVRLKDTAAGQKTIPTSCTQSRGREILASDAFRNELDTVEVISPSPVLTEINGKLEIACNMKVLNKILAAGDAPPIPGTLAEAKEILLSVLKDFNFKTKADHSRALASLITPALVPGKLLKGRAPIDLSEADQSQAGKGMRSKICTAIYNQAAAMINFGGGLGGAAESFDSNLCKGKTVLQFDNVRGPINSQKFETFMTESEYQARPAYSKYISIDPSRTLIYMTSNKAEMTRDLANRSAAVRLLKQPMDYKFKTFPEGDVLDHIQANQPMFLGAVFKVVMTWFDQGCPVDEVAKTKHDFRAWAGTLNYIVTEILDEPDMFKGYKAVCERLHNPNLSWAHDVGMALVEAAKSGSKLRTAEIIKTLEDCEKSDLIPGLKEWEGLDDDRSFKKALRVFGKRMQHLFKDTTELSLEDILIAKSEQQFPRDDGKGYRKAAFYYFETVEAA